jgi:AraC family transcriptional regulator
MTRLCSQSGQYHGDLRKNWSRDGLGIYEVTYVPRLAMSKHAHETSRSILVIQGTVRHRSIGEVECGPQTVVFVGRNEVHDDAVGDAGARCFIVEFGDEWLKRTVGSDPNISSTASLARSNGLLAGMLGRVRQECKYSDNASPLVVDGLLLEVLGQARRACSEKSSAVPPYVHLVSALLRERLRERLTISELAVEAGIHPVHLCREFRRHTGVTIGERLRRIRLEYACTALAGAKKSIAEIALDAGFSSQAHFSATFHRMMHLSPRAYQELARGR